MNRILLAGIAGLMAVAAQPSQAADLAPVYKAPVAAIETFSWTGVYVGVHAGGVWSTKDWNQTFSSLGGGAFLSNSSADLDGGLVGFQIGFNYQMGTWVVGLESDWAWTGADGCGTQAGFPGLRNCSNLNWIYTLTGRVGYAGWSRALVYVKGGFAVADDDHIIRNAAGDASDNPGGTRRGWTLGAGVEYAFGSNWSAKIEYNYVNLEDSNHQFVYFAAPNAGLVENWRIEQDIHIVKVGLNYRFWSPGPVVAKY
jgi:outer membrane immunogenic protein